MNSPFQKATKTKARLRAALIGPSGSGKTFTALRIAKGLGGKVAVIDTERGSASKYADQFAFDVLELESFHPQRYIDAINAAGAAGYDVLVIDSLSHAWEGKDGALELVDNAARRSKSGNSFAAWKEVTPLHHQLVDSILRARPHVLVTMRTKTEWVLEKDEKTGRQAPRKVGLAPVQRAGMEYEFDVVADMDEATLVVSKSRCPALTKAVMKEPGEDLAAILKAWLTDGADMIEPARTPPPPPTQLSPQRQAERVPPQASPLPQAAPVQPQAPAKPPPANGGSAQNATLRAKIKFIHDKAEKAGLKDFQGWIRKVTGREGITSTDLVADDMPHLEAALPELSLPAKPAPACDHEWDLKGVCGKCGAKEGA